MVIGGIVGGILGSNATNVIIDWITQKAFDVPKEESLENAYRYLDVKPSASNNEVNSAFHKLCLKHHPDKRGKAEDFYLTQFNMQVVRVARGEY